jgi:hypothetical protein
MKIYENKHYLINNKKKEDIWLATNLVTKKYRVQYFIL